MKLKDYYDQNLDLTNPKEGEYEMPDINDVYKSNSNYLKADDLKGHEIKAKIDIASVQSVGDADKLVLSFAGKEKTLVLNKTNASAIAAAHGTDYEKWGGKEIFLYPSTTEFQGKSVPCIRVRPVLPTADFDDAIPF